MEPLKCRTSEAIDKKFWLPVNVLNNLSPRKIMFVKHLALQESFMTPSQCSTMQNNAFKVMKKDNKVNEM